MSNDPWAQMRAVCRRYLSEDGSTLVHYDLIADAFAEGMRRAVGPAVEVSPQAIAAEFEDYAEDAWAE